MMNERISHYRLMMDGGLARTVYARKQLRLREGSGMWRFRDWLPSQKVLPVRFGSVTYRSRGLASRLGLKNLFIAFCGYWPEKEAFNMTCDFKDLEAAATIAKLQEEGFSSVTVVSAGNTARAFAFLSSITGFEVRIIVPRQALSQVWLPCVPGKNIILMAVEHMNYAQTIKASGVFLSEDAKPETGTYNVARRDGIGTILLEAVTVMGRLPDHYFQAIGSGIGAIAAYEAAQRLVEDGRFGNNLPRLHLAQNEPFAPVHRAWTRGDRHIDPQLDMPQADDSISQIMADVLSNKNPLYSVKGGLYDCLSRTGGRTYGVTNQEALDGLKLISSEEGIDFLPPVGVCVASLIQALRQGVVAPHDLILLNATGGGVKRISRDYKIYPVPLTWRLEVKKDLMEVPA